MNPITTKTIDIFVECYWELRPKDWDEKKVTDQEYVDKYHGGWNIVKCAGHPEINGAMGTPDMMALFPTEESIKAKFINEYTDRYPQHQVRVHIKITKDDRNPTMDSYF